MRSCDIQVNSLTQSQIISHIYANSNNLCYACPLEGTAGQNPPGWRNFCGMLILLLWVHLFSRPSKKGPLCPGCLLGWVRWSLVSLTFAWANGLLCSFPSQAETRNNPKMLWCIWDWPKDLFTEYHRPLGDLGSGKVNLSINTIEITSCECTDRCVMKMGGWRKKTEKQGEKKGKTEVID